MEADPESGVSRLGFSIAEVGSKVVNLCNKKIALLLFFSVKFVRIGRYEESYRSRKEELEQHQEFLKQAVQSLKNRAGPLLKLKKITECMIIFATLMNPGTLERKLRPCLRANKKDVLADSSLDLEEMCCKYLAKRQDTIHLTEVGT